MLSGKEFRSLSKGRDLMVLIVFAFTAAIYSVAKGVKAEVSNASVAVIDGDHSELSRRLRRRHPPALLQDAGRRRVAPKQPTPWIAVATSS